MKKEKMKKLINKVFERALHFLIVNLKYLIFQIYYYDEIFMYFLIYF